MPGPEDVKPVLLGRYALVAKIADGGMATLYLGRAADGGPDDLAALKVIKDGLTGDEVYEAMFLDEARILSMLSHPNVIRTHGFGITPGGHGYIAMELLLGRTLADAWDEHARDDETMPLALGAWICARVAEGLHSAHALRDENGELLRIIHRDVNPSNVFLTHDGQVKLIDFGLAHARKRAAKTGDGIVKGKIPYLAPEQTKRTDIDRRVDIFALGATLWEVCTGRRLFKRDTDAGTLQAVRDADIPDVRRLRPDIPDALATIVHRALAEDPADRYGTAGELHRALDAFLDAEYGHVERAARAAELGAYLDAHFPGERARQLAWVEAARGASTTFAPTVPPPAPVAAAPAGATTPADAASEEALGRPRVPIAVVVTLGLVVAVLLFALAALRS
ncbi:MAG TPA: serine/threonine-protein kinase [Polyangiaceae bacterium]|nr:serine/threonine-protein kinase [Polyangiaceae bacterium]